MLSTPQARTVNAPLNPAHADGLLVNAKVFWPANLTRVQASRYLGEVHGIPVKSGTLARWACRRAGGPSIRYFGKRPLYPRDLLDQWATSALSPVFRPEPGLAAIASRAAETRSATSRP